VVSATGTSAKTFAAGTREVSTITNIADTGAFEVDTITCVADTGEYEVQTVTWTNFAGGAQGDYIVLKNAAGTDYAFWIDKDDNGTQPTGAAYLAVAAGRRIRIDTTTGDTAAQIGALFATAAAAMAATTVVDGGAGTVTLTQTQFGNVTAPDPHNTGDTGVGSITHATSTGGVASEYAGKYFNISTALDGILHYVWFTVDGKGTDPAPASRTAIPVVLTKGISANAAADAIAAALDALPGYVAPNPAAAAITCTRAALGNCTNAANVDVGGAFAIANTTAGATSNLQSTYFVLYGATAGGGAETGYYFWFNVSSLGADPAPAGLTSGGAIALTAGASANTISGLVNTAVDGHAAFASTDAAPVVTVTNANRGSVTNGSVGTVPAAFAIAVTTPGVDPGMSLSGDTVTLASHALTTGQKFAATSSATLPAGLSVTDYFAIVVDSNTIKVASSYANALAGAAIDITDYGTEAATHTFTPTTMSHAWKIQLSNDGTNWIDRASSSQTATDSTGLYWEHDGINYNYIRMVLTVTSGTGAADYSARISKQTKGPFW
jgi:hypothetical protein